MTLLGDTPTRAFRLTLDPYRQPQSQALGARGEAGGVLRLAWRTGQPGVGYQGQAVPASWAASGSVTIGPGQPATTKGGTGA